MLKSKINSVYEQHSKERICQGDILRDFVFRIARPGNILVEIKFEYVIILSQDCDLQHCLNKKTSQDKGKVITEVNQFLPNVLFLPAFPSTLARSGDHLLDIYDVKQVSFNSERWRVVAGNNNERYHILPANLDFQIPELFLDFKLYFTIEYDNIKEVYTQIYLATINELFRENLSQRYANYFNRIGLPEIIQNPIKEIAV